LRKLYHKGIKQ